MPTQKITQIITKKSFLQKEGIGILWGRFRVDTYTFEFGEFNLNDELYPVMSGLKPLWQLARTMRGLT